MAARVLPLADHSRKVSRVDVLQPGLHAVFDDAHQILGRRAAVSFGHLVIRMKRRHVPWHQRIDAGEKLGHALQVVRIIAEIRHDDLGNSGNPLLKLGRDEFLDMRGDEDEAVDIRPIQPVQVRRIGFVCMKAEKKPGP